MDELVIPEMVRTFYMRTHLHTIFSAARVGIRHFAARVSDGSVHAAMGVGLGA